MSTGHEMARRRDPMLAAALDLHGAEWRPGGGRLRLVVKGLPYVSMDTFDHTVRWTIPQGDVQMHADYSREAREWSARITLPVEVPQTVLHRLKGQSLALLVDLPGADAWLIGEEALDMLGGGIHLTRNRLAASGESL